MGCNTSHLQVGADDGGGPQVSSPEALESQKLPKELSIGGKQKLEEAALEEISRCARRKEAQNAQKMLMYKGAPKPFNETARLLALKALNILDTTTDDKLDRITAFVSKIFDCPVALITLVDAERQWLKSAQGFPACTAQDRNCSFCAWSLLPEHPEMLLVDDALLDARFRDNPVVVGPPNVRFYAGAPLVTSSGYRVGSLCVLDLKPRHFGPDACNLLCSFAEIVVRQIEATRAQEMTESFAPPEDGVMLCNTVQDRWPILYTNDAWTMITGIPRELADVKPVWELFAAEGQTSEETWKLYQQTWEIVSSAVEFQTVAIICSEPDRMVTLKFRPALKGLMDSEAGMIVVPSAVGTQETENILDRTGNLFFASVKRAKIRRSIDAEVKIPFQRTALGPLVNKGPFYRSHRADHSGVKVTLKVVQWAPPASAPETPLPEIGLSLGIDHPNLIRTIDHATGPLPKDMARRRFGECKTLTLGADGGLVLQENAEGAQETWIMRDFCDKGSLQEGIEQGVFLTLPSALEGVPDMLAIVAVARDIASGMAHLHSLGMVLADLSSRTVALATFRREACSVVAKISDFGLLHQVGAASPEVSGPISYLAPEVLAKKAPFSQASDVYSFGILLWEMYSGQNAWVSCSHEYISAALEAGDRPMFRVGSPAAYMDLVLDCWQDDPKMRPTFKAVLETLDKLDAMITENAKEMQPPPPLFNPADI